MHKNVKTATNMDEKKTEQNMKRDSPIQQFNKSYKT